MLATGGRQLGKLAKKSPHPPLKKRGFLDPKSSDSVRVFLRSPRGSTGAASFKSNLPAQPDFSEILQDRHRPPRDLADGLMRNSSSLGGDFKGRQPLAWQTQFFFRTQLPVLYVVTAQHEFANAGKLTWQTGKLNGHLGSVVVGLCVYKSNLKIDCGRKEAPLGCHRPT